MSNILYIILATVILFYVVPLWVSILVKVITSAYFRAKRDLEENGKHNKEEG